MDAQLKSQLKQIVRVGSPAASADIYGQISVASTATVYARVEEHHREFQLYDGDTIKTRHIVILDSSAPTPTYSSYIWLPDVANTTSVALARRVMIIRITHDERGNLDHYEVEV